MKHLLITTAVIGVILAFDINALVTTFPRMVFQAAWVMLLAAALGVAGRKRLAIAGVIGASIGLFLDVQHIWRERHEAMSMWLLPAMIIVICLLLRSNDLTSSEENASWIPKFQFPSTDQFMAILSLTGYVLGTWFIFEMPSLLIGQNESGQRLELHPFFFGSGMAWAPIYVVPIWAASLAVIAPLAWHRPPVETSLSARIARKTGSVFSWIGLIVFVLELLAVFVLTWIIIQPTKTSDQAVVALFMICLAYLLSWTGWIVALTMLSLRLVTRKFNRFPDHSVVGLILIEIVVVLVLVLVH